MNPYFRKFFSGLRRWFEAFGERRVHQYRTNLESLPFFHSLHFGADAHMCPGWKSSDGMFHSDAPVALVVMRGSKVSGVVGFEIIGSTLLVRQLQGAPRGNFHDGVTVEAYLLQCAENIAHALRMKALRIVTAETAIMFRYAAPPADRPSKHAEVHMRKIYSYPATVGYLTSFCWRVRQPTFYRALS